MKLGPGKYIEDFVGKVKVKASLKGMESEL